MLLGQRTTGSKIFPETGERWHVIKKAEELGATTSYGINWVWASGFPSMEKAEEFIRYLDSHGVEHRGIYPDRSRAGFYDIRFRPEEE